MKRILFLLIALAVAAFAGWYYWQFSQRLSSAPVAALLPRETIFVAQIPDFNQARDEWQHCDIYQLYREPAVQDFLLKPLGNAPKTDAVSQTLLEIEQLAPKNAFVALTSIDNNNPKIVGGFRFRGSQEEAERIIGKWRSLLKGQNSSLKGEKVQYQGHEIEVTKAAAMSIATAYDPPWFFVGSDAPDVQALLDRADRRSSSSDNRLDKDETYRAAVSRQPSNDVAFFYLQPKTFRSDSRRCALLSDRPRLPARARCSRKCTALSARCDSRTEKYTMCFSWACRSWSRTRPSRARRCLSERKRRSFTSRCCSISGKEWTLSTRWRPLQVRKFFRRLAIAGSPPLIGRRHSASSSDLWLIGLQARIGRRCL